MLQKYVSNNTNIEMKMSKSYDAEKGKMEMKI